MISKLNEELSLLNIQCKEKEQEIRIIELKLKELTKFRKLTSQVNENNQVRRPQYPTRLYNNRAISANSRTLLKPINGNISKSPSRPKLATENRPFSINDVKFDLNTKYKTNYLVNDNEEMLARIQILSTYFF